MGFLTLLIPVLSQIFGTNGAVGQYLKTKNDKVQAEATLALEVQKNKIELSKAIAQAEVDKQRNQLAATSQTFKSISFFLLNVPIIITCISKGMGQDLWTNLNLVPVWYAQLYVAVVFVIWGLPTVANASGTIFASIQAAWDIRNQGKIQKIQALGEAQQIGKDAAKKEIFDTMKKAVGLSGYTQQQVDIISPILDKLLASNNTSPASGNVTVNTGE